MSEFINSNLTQFFYLRRIKTPILTKETPVTSLVATKIVGRKLISWDGDQVTYLTECNRIYRTTKKNPRGFLIQPNIFNNIKNVVIVNHRDWMVSFNDGRLSKFVVGDKLFYPIDYSGVEICDDVMLEMKLEKSIDGIKELIELPYNYKRNYIAALDEDNNIVTIHCDNIDNLVLDERARGIGGNKRVVGSCVIVDGSNVYSISEIPKFIYHSERRSSSPVMIQNHKIDDLRIRDIVVRGKTCFIISDDRELYAKSINYKYNSRLIRLDIGEIKPDHFVSHSKDEDKLRFFDHLGRHYEYNTKTYELIEWHKIHQESMLKKATKAIMAES